LMTTAAGVLGMIVSQAIGALLLDMYFLKPILVADSGGLAVESGGTSVEDGSFGRLGIGRI